MRRDGKGRGLSSFVGWVRYLSQYNTGGNLFQRGGQLWLWRLERLENLSDEVTEGRSNVTVEEERVERGGCCTVVYPGFRGIYPEKHLGGVLNFGWGLH